MRASFDPEGVRHLHGHLARHVAVLVLDLVQDEDQVALLVLPFLDERVDLLAHVALDLGLQLAQALEFDLDDAGDLLGDVAGDEALPALELVKRLEQVGFFVLPRLQPVGQCGLNGFGRRHVDKEGAPLSYRFSRTAYQAS